MSEDNPFVFEGFEPANTTPVPDILFDKLLTKLSGTELKVLLYIIRRTRGFQKETDAISLSQFTDGIVTKEGKVLDEGCGITNRTAVNKALVSLEKLGCIRSTKGKDPQGDKATTLYSIHFREAGVVQNAYHPIGSTNDALPRSAKRVPPVVQNAHYGSTQNVPGVVQNAYLQETVIQQTDSQETVIQERYVDAARIDTPTPALSSQSDNETQYQQLRIVTSSTGTTRLESSDYTNQSEDEDDDLEDTAEMPAIKPPSQQTSEAARASSIGSPADVPVPTQAISVPSAPGDVQTAPAPPVTAPLGSASEGAGAGGHQASMFGEPEEQKTGKDKRGKKDGDITQAGPPVMPSDGVPWTAETIVQVHEAHKGRRYPNGAKRKSDRIRDNELEAAQSLLLLASDLWTEETATNCGRLLKIIKHVQTRKDSWWLKNVEGGYVDPHHLTDHDRVHTMWDELARMDSGNERTTANSNGKYPPTVSGRRRLDLDDDLPSRPRTVGNA